MHARPPEIAPGFTAEDYEEDPVEIWPASLQAFGIFQFCFTQWRHGFGGPTGLDYNVLFRRIDRLGLPPDQAAELENDLREMELAALEEIHRKRGK